MALRWSRRPPGPDAVRRLGQRMGAVGAEAVQQQAEVPPPGGRGAGGTAGLQDAGVGPGQEGEVFEGEVGAELPALLGAVDHLGDQVEQAGLDGLHGGGTREPHAHRVVEAAVGGLQPAGLFQVGGEAVPGVVGGHGLLCRVDVGLDGIGQHRVQQLHAAGEATVQGPDADPGAAGDLLQRRLQAVVAEHLAGVDTNHPHRGFDNLWYLLKGSVSTGHSTGPGGAMQRARLSAGALLALRAGRGAWHAEALGADELAEGHADTGFRGVLFWVNLARKDKHLQPSALVVQPEQLPVRHQGDATVRVLVGEGSPVRLGTPALILDVALPTGGQITTPVPAGFQGFAYVLDGEAAFGANRRPARPAQLVVLGPGAEFAVTDAAPGTRFLLMTGQPYGEVPVFNGPFVD